MSVEYVTLASTNIKMIYETLFGTESSPLLIQLNNHNRSLGQKENKTNKSYPKIWH